MVRLNSKLKTVIDYMAGNASGKDEAQEPCVLIGYPSRKDEPILPSRNFPDKSFVDQACWLDIGRLLFCAFVFIDLDGLCLGP